MVVAWISLSKQGQIFTLNWAPKPWGRSRCHLTVQQTRCMSGASRRTVLDMTCNLRLVRCFVKLGRLRSDTIRGPASDVHRDRDTDSRNARPCSRLVRHWPEAECHDRDVTEVGDGARLTRGRPQLHNAAARGDQTSAEGEPRNQGNKGDELVWWHFAHCCTRSPVG